MNKLRKRSRKSTVSLCLMLCIGIFLIPGVIPGRAGIEAANDIFVDTGQLLGNWDSRGAALGDLDGDGDVDAFSANHGDGNRVWLNNGAAVFTDSGQIVGTQSSTGVALGDVDGDGDLDAFVTSPTTKLFLNQGGSQGGNEGTFADSGYNLGSDLLQDVALGDLDGDGDLDALAADLNSSNVFFINQGGDQGGTPGYFLDDGQFVRVGSTYAVALGDIDGDGDLDAAIGNFLQTDDIWVNQGGDQGGTEGIFEVGQYIDDPDNDCYGVSLGDLDGDNDLDIYFANYQLPDKVWLNDGGGAFTDSGQLLGSSPSRGVDLGDLDGDNDLDAVVANYQEDDQVYLNDGQGNFSLVQVMDNVLSYDLMLGDLDGNGSLDVFIANQLANRVWIGANKWDSFEPAPNSQSAPLDTQLMASTESVYDASTVLTGTFIVHGEYLGRVIGHIPFISASKAPDTSQAWFDPDEDFFSGELVQATLTDGITDLDGVPFAPYVWQFRISVLGGSAVFSDTLQNLGDALSHGVALGDVDDDGDLDAVVVNGTAQYDKVWLNAGGDQGGIVGQFIPGSNLEYDQSLDVVMGDLNGDHFPDIIVVRDGIYNDVYLNDGAGNFVIRTIVGSAQGRGGALGDLDADGDLDLFLANNHANHVWWNDGTGMFSFSGQNLGDENSMDVALGDVNNDGDLDALVVNSGVNNLWVNDGLGGFVPQSFGTDWSPSYGVALGDLNGDGFLDAFIGNYASPNEVWMNTGTGTYTVTQSLGVNEPTYAVDLGDLDGDGDLDAFIANNGIPNQVWLNDGSGTFSDGGQALGESFSEDVALGDLDLDGDLDAFVANLAGPNRVWENLDTVTHLIFLPYTSK